MSSPTSARCSDPADLCRHRSSQTKCLLSGAQDRAALSTSNTDHANLARPEPSTVRPPPSDNHLSRLRSTGTRPRASPRTIVFDPTQQMTQVAAGPGDQRHNTLHAVGRRCYAIEPHEFVLAAGARHDRIVGSCLQPFSPGTRDPAVRRGGLVRSIPVSVLRSLFFVPVLVVFADSVSVFLPGTRAVSSVLQPCRSCVEDPCARLLCLEAQKSCACRIEKLGSTWSCPAMRDHLRVRTQRYSQDTVTLAAVAASVRTSHLASAHRK